MRIVITGATSFIGRAVGDTLSGAGHELTLFRHSFIEEELPERADCWIHLAWGGAGSIGRQDEAVQEGNVAMSEAAYRKAREIGCGRFIFAGSQAEYGHAQDGALKKEDGPALPVSAYGSAKLKFGQWAQAEAAQGGMEFVHLRFFSVYGPGDHEQSLISTLVREIRAGHAMELSDCSQLWNYLYIEDAADAVRLIAQAGEVPQILNIAGDDTRTLRNYVEEAARIVGGEEGARLLGFGKRGDNAEGPADLSPDVSRLERLGYRPRCSFAEGIRKLL